MRETKLHKHYNTKYTGIGKLIEMLSKNQRTEDR